MHCRCPAFLCLSVNVFSLCGYTKGMGGSDTPTVSLSRGTLTSMIMAAVLCVLVWLLFGIQRSEGVRTVRKVTVQRGGSATIPCHYEEKHKAKVKYWCRGYTWDTCSVLIRTSSPPAPDAELSISDDVTQCVFTVFMTTLQDRDSDVYWCAVDITGPDDKAYLKMMVIPGPPELYTESSVFSGPVYTESSVFSGPVYTESSVFSGPAGGLVQVQCLYGDRLRSSVKKWCRGGTDVCLTAGRTSRLHKYTLRVDAKTGALTVTIRDLSPKDAGWYYCTGGDTQLPVFVSVTLETHTPPVTQGKTTSRTTQATTPAQTTAMKTAFTSDATTLLQKASQPEACQQTLTVPSDESIQTSLGKIPSLEILLKIPVAVVYLVCLAVAIKKYCEMNR